MVRSGRDGGPDSGWVDEVMSRAGLGSAELVTPLAGGTFNTVLRVTTRDGDAVIKVAPGPEQALLSYEHGIMATEALYYELAAQHGITTVPRMLHYGHIGDVETLVLSVVPGQPWPQLDSGLDDEQRYALRSALGTQLAALHRITGTGFGYPARPLVPTWRAAYLGMVDALLDDARRYGVELPAARIQRAIERESEVLDDIRTPVLVHFDLWDGNILVDAGPRLGGLIDAERAFWGDPLAEFASLRLYGDLTPDAGLVAGYRGGGGRLVLDESELRRLALYRVYLYLIMWVETVPRGFDAHYIDERRRAVLEPVLATVTAWERGYPAAR